MSSIEKRQLINGRVYVIRFRDALGKQHTKSLGTSEFAVAQKIKTKLDSELAQEKWGVKKLIKPIRLSDFRRIYITTYSSVNKAAKTVINDRAALKKLEEIIGDVFMNEITSRNLETFKSERLKNVKPVTVNIELRHIKAAFNKAIEWEYQPENPMKTVKQLKIRGTNLPKFLRSEQITALLQIIGDPVHHALFNFYAGTGCRRSEALYLKWEEIDFENSFVCFSDTKSGKSRIIPLSIKLRKLLYDLPKTEERVFPFEGSYVSKLFRRYAQKINLSKNLKLHSLRHSFLTYAVATSKNLRGAQNLAGHSNVSVTEIYTHVLPEDLRSIVEGLPY